MVQPIYVDRAKVTRSVVRPANPNGSDEDRISDLNIKDTSRWIFGLGWKGEVIP